MFRRGKRNFEMLLPLCVIFLHITESCAIAVRRTAEFVVSFRRAMWVLDEGGVARPLNCVCERKTSWVDCSAPCLDRWSTAIVSWREQSLFVDRQRCRRWTDWLTDWLAGSLAVVCTAQIARDVDGQQCCRCIADALTPLQWRSETGSARLALWRLARAPNSWLRA